MEPIYKVIERESPPWIVEVNEADGFLLNNKFTTDFRIRGHVYEMLKKANASLPAGYRIVVYEAFRPRKRQWELWNWMEAEMKRRHPDATEDEIYKYTREFIADPRGFGSGHQAGGAVDVSLAGPDGKELDMGTAVDEMNDRTRTHSSHITSDQRANRAMLLAAMEAGGLVNYPSEWWHFCYGDRLWAEMTGAEVAFFAPLQEE
ncbi:MAG: D-alanyl-D-alanine carboxypeptidase family protein [Candidatus Sumerlaeia bacterium]|nr:D-alanyl-D-alanine carboxypeptidase family protein [Candidatus Sumerlaeia bacterium]